MKLPKIMFGLLAGASITVLALSPTASPALAQPGSAASNQTFDYVPGELLVGLERLSNGELSSEVQANIASAAQAFGAEIASSAEDGSFVLLRFKSDADASASVAILSQLKGIRYVERNGLVSIPPMPPVERNEVNSAAFYPNDPGAGYQWHLEKILYHRAPAPVDTNVPCIVVLDTGVDYTHDDLSGKVYKGKDLIQNDFDPMDVQGHGTHVAGIAAGKTNNALGIAGVSPESNILAVRVLNDLGSGTWEQVASGILWANNQVATRCGGQEPKIYNMSLGGAGFSQTIADAVAAASAKGRLLVAAAGNNNSGAYHSPASDPNAFAVGASDINDNRTWFSNYGTVANPWVDIAAPGYYIMSSVMGDDYEGWNGTSMSTPVVAGVAARVWARFPSLTNTQLINRLKNTGDRTYGFPAPVKRVNLLAALGRTDTRILQGQLLDPFTSGALMGANVKVKSGATEICNIITKADGLYTCELPGDGTYTVSVSKAGFAPINPKFAVSGRKFNANIAVSRAIGSGSGDDWVVSVQWKGWQPLQTTGKEFDLFAVRPSDDTKCYSPISGSSLPSIQVGAESWNTYIKAGEGQSESIHLFKAAGGQLQIWLALNKDNGNIFPANARLTGSGARITIYRNNQLVQQMIAPTSPTTGTSDLWFVGTLNLDVNTFTPKNVIRTTQQGPACIQDTQSSID